MFSADFEVHSTKFKILLLLNSNNLVIPSTDYEDGVVCCISPKQIYTPLPIHYNEFKLHYFPINCLIDAVKTIDVIVNGY